MSLSYLNPGLFAIIWFVVSSIGIMMNWHSRSVKAILLVLINAVVIGVCSYCYNWYHDLDLNCLTTFYDEMNLEITCGIPAGSRYLHDMEKTKNFVHCVFIFFFVVSVVYGVFCCYYDNGKNVKWEFNFLMVSVSFFAEIFCILKVCFCIWCLSLIMIFL